MKIFIRADASTQIGTGHVVRCLTLADELTQRGAEIGFICIEDPGNLIKFIEGKGYSVYPLPSGIDRETDKKLTQNILRNRLGLPDWLIIDHYGLDFSYETSFREYVKRLMVIDDLAERRHDCDILLNQTYGLNPNHYQGFVPKHCIQLLGAEYTLLRPQFRKTRENLQRSYDKVKRMLVFMGGSDPDNETCKVIRAFQRLDPPDILTDVIIGKSNPWRHEVEALALQTLSITCRSYVENMAEMMAAADIGIGASGTTTWERCCVGLPSIVMILAENQRKIAEELDKKGIVINLGWYEGVTVEEIKTGIEQLLHHENLRRKLSIAGQHLVDGRGTGRVMENIIRLSV